jgi:hypothetical protein
VPGGASVCEQLVVRVTAAGGATLINSATIDSDETPPTTRTQPTAVALSVVCDADADGDIDKRDIDAILRVRGQTVQAGDTRDADADGVITVRDAKLCIQRCTRPSCALQ